jgi:hypothetical protein
MAGAIPQPGMGAPQPYMPPHMAGAEPAVLMRPEETGYRGNHPVAAFFHFIFKALALLIYLIASVAGISYVSEFITVTLLLAADFWVVKNVTGRLLVALRWWNHVKDDGESEWIFESHPMADRVATFDKYFFWILTYGFLAGWSLLVVFSLTSFGKLPLTLLGAVLSGANAIGFTKCSRDAQKKMTDVIVRQAQQHPDAVASAAATAAKTATTVASAAHVAQPSPQAGGR